MIRKSLSILILIFFCAIFTNAQDLPLSAQSYRQKTPSTQNITSAAAQTGVPVTGDSYVLLAWSGTYGSAAANFQLSWDGGTNYRSVEGYVVDATGPCLQALSTGTLTNTTKAWLISTRGATHFRQNVTAIASGTLNSFIVAFSSPGSACEAAHKVNPIDLLIDSVASGGLARTSDQTAVSNNTRILSTHDAVGKQIVLPFAIPENFRDGTTAAVTGTSDTTVIAAQGAGIRLYITSVIVSNSHATVATVVECKDGSGGTVKLRQYAHQTGGGFTYYPPTPIRLTANTAFVCTNVTTGSNTYFTATGYAAP